MQSVLFRVVTCAPYGGVSEYTDLEGPGEQKMREEAPRGERRDMRLPGMFACAVVDCCVFVLWRLYSRQNAIGLRGRSRRIMRVASEVRWKALLGAGSE